MKQQKQITNNMMNKLKRTKIQNKWTVLYVFQVALTEVLQWLRKAALFSLYEYSELWSQSGIVFVPHRLFMNQEEGFANNLSLNDNWSWTDSKPLLSF